MLLKDMILNYIKKYNFGFYKKKKIFKILRILTSILLFANKSLTISMFPFSTAKYNAVSWNHIIKISLKNESWISLIKIILNFINKNNFEFH